MKLPLTAAAIAGAIAAMQLYWYALILNFSPQAALYFPLFALGAAGELAIPVLAINTEDTANIAPVTLVFMCGFLGAAAREKATQEHAHAQGS